MSFPSGAVVKNVPVNAGDVHLIPDCEDPEEQDMATLCSILDWKIPWTDEPGGLQPMGSQRFGPD